MRISVKEAARILGKGYTPELIYRGLQQGKFPFGVAIEGEATEYYEDGKTTYVIESDRLMVWKSGADIKNGI